MGFLPYFCAGALLGAVYVFPERAAAAAREGLAMWAGSVAPGLGPAMALCSYLCSRAKGRGMAVAASVLCGSPGGAKLMAKPGEKGQNAMHDAALCGIMSPMFFLGAMAGWLGDKKAAALVYACHLAGAFFTAMCFPGSKKQKESVPLGFMQCVEQSVKALLQVAFLLMLGAVAAEMAACAFPFLPEQAKIMLQCTLEVTGGVKKLIDLRPDGLLPRVCAFTAFGGLSILMQNYAYWKETGLKGAALAMIQLLHGGISFVLCFFLQNILHIG